jgi:hypothetical protein
MAELAYDNTYEIQLEETPKLTDWANEPTVRDLKQDYTEARPSHSSQCAEINRWLDNLFVRGGAKIEKVKGRSTIVPKLIRKQAEWRYTGLSEPFLNEEDLFQATPRTHMDKQAAYENVLVLNYQFNTLLDKVNFIDEYVRTAVDEGTVVIRVGWDFEEEEAEVSDEQQGLVEVFTETLINQPTLDICPFNNVIIDPTCNGKISKAQFVIYRFETSMSDLEKSGKYKNLSNIDIESNSILSEPDADAENPSSFNFKDKPRKKFWAYEYWGYWDIDGTGVTKPFVATWVGDTMIRMEESPFPDKKLPFVVVQYLPRRNSSYGEPDGELLEDNQKVTGAVTRGMVDIMGRSAAGQKGTRTDALDITNRRKFEMGEDYEFNAHIDPRQAFFEHSFPEIPQSAQFMLELQQLEAESLTGVKAFHGGISGEGLGPHATGARGALDAAGKRELGILRRLANGLKEVGYKIMAMNGEFLSDEEIIPITDEQFVTINRENLVGRFDLKLDISSSETDNIKAQELAFMLQTMGNTMPPEMSQIILADIARLRKMPELAKKIREYQPEPDPIQQEMRMLELEKLKAEVAKLHAESQDKHGEGMYGMARAQTELAKARHLNAQADMLDLDFVEEETGTKHERDMQKQGAQAKANMVMKDREALAKDRNTLLGALVRPPTANK